MDRADHRGPPAHVATERARGEACRRVGRGAHSVAAVARGFGTGWHTINRAVWDPARPLVDDPARLAGGCALGVDEHSFTCAQLRRPTRYVTGLVDLTRGRLLDVVDDRAGTAVSRWLAAKDRQWLGTVERVALDPHQGYRNALLGKGYLGSRPCP